MTRSIVRDCTLLSLIMFGAFAYEQCAYAQGVIHGNGDPRTLHPTPNCAFGRFYVDDSTQQMYQAMQGSPCSWSLPGAAIPGLSGDSQGNVTVQKSLASPAYIFSNSKVPPTASDGSLLSTQLALSPYTFGAKCDATINFSTNVLTGTNDEQAFRSMLSYASAVGESAQVQLPAGHMCRVDRPGGVPTTFAISGNQITFQVVNSLAAGDVFTPRCFSSTNDFLNGAPLVALASGLSGTQVSAVLYHADVLSTSDSGGGAGCDYALTDAAAPTITQAGTPGSTSYSYEVIPVTQFGTGAGAVATTTTGNAQLGSASGANCNVINWSPVTGAEFYWVYRTASSGTPGYVKQIANISQVYGAVTTANDCGTTINSSTATVSQGGTGGSTAYTYEVLANVNGAVSEAVATTSTGNATLTGINTNIVTWTPIAGANSYALYRTAGGATQGFLNVVTGTTFTDGGASASNPIIPATNTTVNAPATLESPALPLPVAGGVTVYGSNPQAYRPTVGANTVYSSAIVGVGVGPVFQLGADESANVISSSLDGAGTLTINYTPMVSNQTFTAGLHTVFSGSSNSALNGSYTIATVGTGTLTITGVAGSATTGVGGLLHTPYSLAQWNGPASGLNLHDFAIVDMDRSTTTQTGGAGISCPIDQFFCFYVPGNYGVKDFRGGNITLSNMAITGAFEFGTWGIQSDFDLFDKFTNIQAGWTAIYMGSGSSPSSMQDIGVFGMNGIWFDGSGSQPIKVHGVHLAGGAKTTSQIVLSNTGWDPIGVNGGGLPSYVSLYDINFERGGFAPGCLYSPRAFISVDSYYTSATMSGKVDIQRPTTVNSGLGGSCNIPFLIQWSRGAHDFGGIDSDQITLTEPMVATQNLSVNFRAYAETLSAFGSFDLNSANKYVLQTPAMEGLGSSVTLYNGKVALNNPVFPQNLTVNQQLHVAQGGQINLDDDGTNISGLFCFFGTGGTTGLFRCQNGGNPTSQRIFSGVDASGHQVFNLTTRGGLSFLNNAGTPWSANVGLFLAPDTSFASGSPINGLVHYRSDLNRFVGDTNLAQTYFATLADLGCSTTGPTGSPSATTVLFGNCAWANPGKTAVIAWGQNGANSFSNNGQTSAELIVPAGITITRFLVHVGTAAVGCSTFPVAQLFDSTASAAIAGTPTTIAASTNNFDSGVLSVNVAASHALFVHNATAAVGCSTLPSGAAYTVQYQMQ